MMRQGNFAAALPHLEESLRLDTQTKTLMNLAHCEEKLGKLVDAHQHWLLGRDRAIAERNEVLRQEALSRIASLEGRIPRLTIRVTGDSGGGVEVLRDGVVLGSVSLGMPLPTDPGKHTILVRAPGRPPKTVEVELAEGETKELALVVDKASTGAVDEKPVTAVTALPAQRPSSDVAVSKASPSSPTRTAGLVVAGAGALGLGVGVVLGAVAKGNYDGADCDFKLKQCSTAGLQTVADAQALGNVGTIVGGIGAAALVAGGVLWFFGPKSMPATVAIGPRGVALLGTW